MGSAKSRCGVMEIIDHALNVPNGRTIIMAQTLKQLSKAIMPIFDEYLPRKFVKRWTDTKQDIQIDLNNGHTIIGMPSDDEEKLRSMDITAFLIEEASGVPRAVYEECLRRMRNTSAIINGKEHFLGIIISNPAQGFIRDLLFSASKIYGSASIKETVAMYKDRVKNPNKNLEAFLSSSRDNKYLPSGFVQNVINSLTSQQVRLYVDCIIEYAEGAVYPEFLQHVVDDFEIPSNWKRFLAHDPGIHDPAAVLLGAQNPDDGVIYFYREFYQTDKVVSQVGKSIKDMISDIPQGCLHMPIIDPASNKRSNIDGKTYKRQLQLEFNLVFKDGNNRLEDGIAKTRDMMYNGKLKFFRSLKETITEGCEYRYYTTEERSKNKNLGDTPVDKNNHLMDCLRYICQEVPYSYMDLTRASYSGIKKFFENMGFTTSNNRVHSTPKSFDDVAQQAINMLKYDTGKIKQRRSSGGFRI